MKTFKVTVKDPAHKEPLFKNSRQGDPIISEWSCLRCGSEKFTIDKVSMTGGILSRIFNFQNRRFVVYTCNKCLHSELFKAPKNDSHNLIDFMSG